MDRQHACVLCTICMFAGNHHYLLHQNCRALLVLQVKMGEAEDPMQVDEESEKSAATLQKDGALAHGLAALLPLRPSTLCVGDA